MAPIQFTRQDAPAKPLGYYSKQSIDARRRAAAAAKAAEEKAARDEAAAEKAAADKVSGAGVTKEEREPERITTPEIFRDVTTGKVTGATFPGGKTFFGLDKDEISRMVARKQLPAGTIEAKGAEGARQERALAEAMALEVGKIQLTGDPIKDKLSYEQAVKSALAGASAGVAGGAAVGAVGGAAVGGVGAIPGAVGGAALGGVSGFIAGFRSNLKTQRTDMVKGEAANLMKQEQNMLKLIMETNKFGNYPVTLTYYNSQMSLISENYGRLQLETTDDLSKWLGEDGHKQLEKYETFYSPGGMRDILNLQMKNAIVNPNPNTNIELQNYLDVSEAELSALEEE